VLLRELTKQFEDRVEGRVQELLDNYTIKQVKGEVVLVLSKERAAGHGAGLVDPQNLEDSGGDVGEDATRE
jgi:16S rRNA C1402 (ribose-2'-O) methylase RsmI